MAYLRGAVGRYQELRMKAEKGDLLQAASALNEVMAFRPPEWLPLDGSGAGWAVVAFRDATVREVLTRMRLLSGEDLGTDPAAWLKKYHKPGETQPNERSGVDAGRALSVHIRPERSGATHRERSPAQ